jgi:hypothetical protein
MEEFAWSVLLLAKDARPRYFPPSPLRLHFGFLVKEEFCFVQRERKQQLFGQMLACRCARELASLPLTSPWCPYSVRLALFFYRILLIHEEDDSQS